MDKFCDLLKEVRAHKEWSQEDLARHVEVSLSTVQRWESNRCMPSRVFRKELNKLFNEIGVTYHFGKGDEGSAASSGIPKPQVYGPEK